MVHKFISLKQICSDIFWLFWDKKINFILWSRGAPRSKNVNLQFLFCVLKIPKKRMNIDITKTLRPILAVGLTLLDPWSWILIYSENPQDESWPQATRHVSLENPGNIPQESPENPYNIPDELLKNPERISGYQITSRWSEPWPSRPVAVLSR